MLRDAAVFAFALVLTGCPKSEEKNAAPVVDAGVKLAPLQAPVTSLMPVAGFANAVLVSPVGATKPMPLVVAVEGIGDTPESQCAVWRELFAQRAFIVCPRFTPHYVPVQQEGDTQGKYVAPGPVLYIGFSRGAFLGATIVANAPSKYARAILIEGGQSAWTDAGAAAYAKGGGKRVLFACGQPSCVGESDPAAQLLSRMKVATKIVHGEGEGHGYKGPVKEQIRVALPWLLEGDPAWR